MSEGTTRAEQPSVRIVTELRRRITTGELAPGDRLPSTRQITRDWGVAMATATKVITALRLEGLVHAVPGVGTVVTAAAAAAPGLPAARGPLPIPDAERSVVAPRRTRTAEAPLSRERIIATAIGIADAFGLGELSMRRVAAELGVATMALYRYVPSKDDLVTLMIDEVYAGFPLPELPAEAGWRTRLEALARNQWAGYCAHQWLASVISFSRPQLIPRGMRHTEYGMAAVRGTGLDIADALHIAVMIAMHVRGAALAFADEISAQQETGITAGEWMESQQAFWELVMSSGEFPMMMEVGSVEGDAMSLETLFEFGLARLLDGVEVHIARVGAKAAGSAG